MTSLRNQVPAFVFGPLIAGLMLAAAARPTHAQTLDAVVGERVAGVARQASRAGQPARRFDLTLDDAVQRALERNLDIAVQRIVPLAQDMQIAAASAAFLPVASSGFDFNQATTPNRFVFDGGGLRGQPIVSDDGTYDLGIGQQIKWGGGRYDVTWDSTRSESTNIFSTFNPSFGANMTLQYTQPLLRGLRTDSRRTQLVVSRINRDISDIDLEETVVNTLANVSLAYWDLVYARAAVGVQRQALDLAEQLVQDNRARVEVGTMAPIDVVAAQSEAAARRQLLALAVETQRTSELALKELIVGGTSDELWNAEIDATEQPRIEATPIDLQEAIRGALDRRTDVSRARRRVDVNQRRASHRVDPRAHRGRDGVAGAGRTTARGGGEQVRGRPVDELLRPAVATRSGQRAGCRAARDSRLPAGADRVRPDAAGFPRRCRHRRGRWCDGGRRRSDLLTFDMTRARLIDNR